jgi:hypothetical protein
MGEQNHALPLKAMAPNPGKHAEKVNFPYREAIGSLIYLACLTRPDIAHAVSYCAQFQAAPTQMLVTRIKGILRYLKGTANLGITYHKEAQEPLFLAVDANFASPRSRSCFAVFRGGACVALRSAKQTTPAQNTTEAEYIATSEGVKKLLWMKELLKELGWIGDEPTKVQIDNSNTIKWVKRTAGMRTHMAVRDELLHFHYERRSIEPEKVRTDENPADIGTKILPINVTDKQSWERKGQINSTCHRKMNGSNDERQTSSRKVRMRCSRPIGLCEESLRAIANLDIPLYLGGSK